MKLKIYYYDHPILRRKCQKIDQITDQVIQLAQNMIETMYQYDGLGLAAPQVGHLLAMFVMREYITQEDGQCYFSEPKVYINPQLSSPSKKKVVDVEGCLSIPKLRLDVERPHAITITALNLEGVAFTERVEGYNARIRMHENDHLNGTLFIDRVPPSVRLQIDPFLKDLINKRDRS